MARIQQMTKIEELLSPSVRKILSIYVDNPDTIENLSGLTLRTKMAFQSVRKYTKMLVELRILQELFVGNKGKVIILNKKSENTKKVFELFSTPPPLSDESATPGYRYRKGVDIESS